MTRYAEQEILELLKTKSDTWLTKKEIYEITDIPYRTLRNAMDEFMRQGIISEKFNFRDGRSPLYRIKPTRNSNNL